MESNSIRMVCYTTKRSIAWYLWWRLVLYKIPWLCDVCAAVVSPPLAMKTFVPGEATSIGWDNRRPSCHHVVSNINKHFLDIVNCTVLAVIVALKKVMAESLLPNLYYIYGFYLRLDPP